MEEIITPIDYNEWKEINSRINDICMDNNINEKMAYDLTNMIVEIIREHKIIIKKS